MYIHILITGLLAFVCTLKMILFSMIRCNLINTNLIQLRGETHPLVENQTLKLVPWTVSGLNCRSREFQRQLPTLSPSQEDQILIQVMTCPGESGPAVVLEGKLIHSRVI